ncbi:hypothetical protein [Rhodoblastus sp.]|uniref:hypothetical protein n=1 Tax=Rhodoblastus sp. TaxID=1962975 RepID=UPI0035B29C28
MFGRAFFVTAAAMAWLVAGAPGALAVEPALNGVKDIVLHTEDGQSIVIGTVTFTPEGDGARFNIVFDDSKFAQYFLSMREFKCVEGPEILCHTPYPYRNPGMVTARDSSWLEHALLFFYKRPADYGAKMAHGLIYTLTMTQDGFIGRPQSIDLEEIAAPPDDLTVAFFTGDHRYHIPAGARWFDSLTIEPHR